MARRIALIGAGVALLGLYAAAQPAPPLAAHSFPVRAPLARAALDAPKAASAADATQIESLLAVQQLKPAPATFPADAGTDATTEIARCVAQNIRTLDPSNPHWNETDPRWEPMQRTIAHDCARRREYRIRHVEPQLQRLYRDALANSYARRLSHREADFLIGFYATETGHRFQAFQNRLTEIEFAAMQNMQALGDREGTVNPPAAAPPEVVKRRASLLLMSRQTLLMVQWQQDAVRAGGDTSSGAVAPMVMSMAAATEGDAIDRVDKEFARDLPAFSAFLASPAEKNEIRALADAQMSFGKASATQLIKLAPEWNGDLRKWRERYRALAHASGTAPASAPERK
ncbi:MAG: DUF2059 domain-containing protein [Paraburkholderia sp.]|nr:MAG: DUF2059 domain-containing protein [Paraburkholderia sp.]